MTDPDIPQAPPYEETKIPRECKLIFFTGKEEKSYCILIEDIIQDDEFYILPIPSTSSIHKKYIKIDETSYNQLTKINVKAFAAIEHDDIFILRPLYKTQKITEKDSKYQTPISLSEGAYGKIQSFPTEMLAVKTFKNNFSDDIVKEIAIYSYFYKISCVPTMIDFDVTEGINIKLELGKATLFSIIDDLSENDLKIIFFRIIKCMMVLASQGIIHTDLKPENCIISQDSTVKIIDWGAAEIDTSKNQTKLKGIIGTPGYRAPEILLEDYNYTYKVDIFSLGIMLYFVYTKGSLPSRDDRKYSDLISQKHLMSRLLGRNWHAEHVTKDFKKFVSGKSVATTIEERLLDYKTQEKVPAHMGIKFDENLADLLSKMLEFNPHYRISYQEIIIHPYFQGIYRERIQKLPIFLNNIGNIEIVDKKLRNSVLKVFLEVANRYKHNPGTLCYAIQIFDEFSTKYTGSNFPRMAISIAGSCMILAVKIFESNDECCQFFENYFDDDIERLMKNAKRTLKILEGNILKPTFYSYFSHFYGEPSISAETYKNILDIYTHPNIYMLPMRDFTSKIVKSRKFPLFSEKDV